MQPRAKMHGEFARRNSPPAYSPEAIAAISAALNRSLADVFALYIKTKNFHWHMSGPHFRDYHLMLDEQSAEILAIADEIAERVRKIGGVTLRSLGQAVQLKTIADNDRDFVTPQDMLAELCDDNRQISSGFREAHAICGEHGDIASCSLLENWVDQAERRAWFLEESTAGSRTPASP